MAVLWAVLVPTASGVAVTVALAQAVTAGVAFRVADGLLRCGLVSRSRVPAVLVLAWMPISLSLVWLVVGLLRGRPATQLLVGSGFVMLGATAIVGTIQAAACLRGSSRASEPARARTLEILSAFVAVLCAVGLVAIDRLVLVRLYQGHHIALRFTALLALQTAATLLACSAVRRKSSSRRGWRVGPALAGVAVVVCVLGTFATGMGLLGARSLSVVLLYGGSAASVADIHVRLPRHPSVGRTASTVPSEVTTGHGTASPVAKHQGPVLSGFNLLLITVDALRADHLGVYGYARPTSPAIDRIAWQGVLFERAYAAAPHTSFALTSLLIGRPAVALAHLNRLSGHPTLADLLHARGYATAAFIPRAVFFVEPERFRYYERAQFGFRHVDMRPLPETESAPLQTDAVLAYLDRYRPRRFAAWVHYFAPHEPYVEHGETSGAFGRSAVDRYDGEIAWADREIGRLVDEVKVRFPRTVVVVTADHGEEFGEHGGAYHGTTLFDEQVRVPLIINAPGIHPSRVTAPVGAVDVLPTLLALLGVPAPFDLPGTDLGPWLQPGAARNHDGTKIAVAENGAVLRMLVGEGHKLICHARWPECLLFNLASDPGELRDLVSTQPAIADRLKRQLGTWVSAAARAPEQADPVVRSFDATVARARLRDPAMASDLVTLLASGQLLPAHRREAARHLTFVTSLQNRNELRQLAVTESDRPTLQWIQIALATLGDEAGVGGLAQALESGALAEGDGDLFVRATLALANARRSLSAGLLVRALGLTDDVETRCELLRALGQSSDKLGAAQRLVAEYEVIRTRVCVARALASLADPGTLSFLVGRLPGEPYADVQLNLVEALKRIRSSGAIPALAALKEATAEPQVRAAVERALLRLRDAGQNPPSVRLRARPGRARMRSG